eukprot:CAMPEP_0115862182 /NCGR_PEP_ID=MMETSP0287-20121206/18044_1 /TAXON_ID=412157 /ORGANISM="Chrysochromulina rotalis, Strain UIO044" /LENGTH=76 /DNA_ID=CAMNT_0003316595 /DNA_START=334 /DNA_END=561 /DNA_ORIENTATION=+
MIAAVAEAGASPAILGSTSSAPAGRSSLQTARLGSHPEKNTAVDPPMTDPAEMTALLLLAAFEDVAGNCVARDFGR